MLPAFKRKFSQLCADPVLRAWLLRRAVGLQKAPKPFAPHLPVYAWEMLPLALADMPGFSMAPVQIAGSKHTDPVTLMLAGIECTFDPASPGKFFEAPVADIEVDLARHRFAWLPLAPTVPAGIFRAAWQTWRERYFDIDGLHWHPYTAAERAINIIDGMQRSGAPSPPGQLAGDLAHHARMISERLEYFGDHDTSNHLANNGRGLYRIGCALDDENCRELGFDILTHEAERIFLPGGTLREGSTHYHLLYLRNYLDAWLCAERHGLDDDAPVLRAIAAELMEAARHLVLPGGLPRIGDISPDCPPSFLIGLERAQGAWAETLNTDDRSTLRTLSDIVEEPASDAALRDGWLRASFGRWSALAHVPDAGWPFMPGHAHQDMGSVEIHTDGKPLFVDPGRGAYGEDGDAALYRSAAMHGALRIDGADPYPPNKPYYNDAFRARHAGPAAAMYHRDGFTIAHGGYKRLGADDVRRRWHFSANGFRIEDGIAGRGSHTVERALVTPCDVRLDGDSVVVGGRFRVACEGSAARLDAVTVWRAYNDGSPGTRIVFESRQSLPWSGTITIEAIN
jgi:hypothetical protein